MLLCTVLPRSTDYVARGSIHDGGGAARQHEAGPGHGAGSAPHPACWRKFSLSGLLKEYYDREGSSPRTLAPAAAARLARARAKLRVSYMLSQADVPLPSDRCQPVLEALSTGDRRRQERLGAGRHLRACAVCASYTPALVERRRAIAALYPLGRIGLAAGAAWGAARRQPARTATAPVAVAALAVTGVAFVGPVQEGQPPSVAPATPAPPASVGVLRIAGTSLLRRRGDQPLPVGAASATRVRVQDVPADEGCAPSSAGAPPDQLLRARAVARSFALPIASTSSCLLIDERPGTPRR